MIENDSAHREKTMKSSILCSFFLILLSVGKSNAFENSIEGSRIASPEELLDCNSYSENQAYLCTYLAQQVLNELNDRDIFITNNEILVYASPVVERSQLDTGHSCTHRAWVKGSSGYISLSQQSTIHIDGNLVETPFVLMANLPVHANATVNIQEKWGFKYTKISCSGLKCKKKSKCSSIATDNWHATFDANTTAKSAVTINMQPQFGWLPNGDYFLSIRPIVYVGLSLHDFSPSVKLHNKNHLAPMFGFILTAPSSASRFLENWLKGDSTAPARDQLYFDIGYSFVSQTELTLNQITGFLGATSDGPGVFSNTLYEHFARKEITKLVKSEESRTRRDLENRLYRHIHESLNLDENGERVWVIHRDDISSVVPNWVIPFVGSSKIF